MDYCYLDSPVGPLLIAGDNDALRFIAFPDKGRARKPEPGWTEGMHGAVAAAVAQLREYFAGRRKEFDLPLAPAGTPFQQQAWAALREIPFGATISYGAPETVKTDAGTFQAWKVGINAIDQDGKPAARGMTVWFSNDARKLPVKMEAALPVGSFTLTLSSVR